MNWFGESWGAPCCDPDLHVETPAGMGCIECGVAIEVGDQGFISIVYPTNERITYHKVCFLRTVIPCMQWTPEMLQNIPDSWREHLRDKHGIETTT